MDRMKILKHGKKFNENSIVTCEKCECEFEYNVSDFLVEKGFDFMTNSLAYQTYVKCPECNTKRLVGIRFVD